MAYFWPGACLLRVTEALLSVQHFHRVHLLVG